MVVMDLPKKMGRGKEHLQRAIHVSFKYFLPVILFSCMIIFLQKIHRDLSPPFVEKTNFDRRTLVPSQALPYIDFGFTNVLADYYWVRSIQDFITWDGDDLYFLGYLRNITTLDPKFEYPHLFTILAVPKPGDAAMLDRVREISSPLLGSSTTTTSWKIPFYLATQYYLFTKKQEPTKTLLLLAASNKNAPSGVYLVYSSFTARTNEGYKTARDLIQVIYNNTNDSVIKELTEKGLAENTIAQMLEKGILAYKTTYKKYPTSLEELVTNKFISLPDAFFTYFTVSINKTNGSFKITSKK